VGMGRRKKTLLNFEVPSLLRVGESRGGKKKKFFIFVVGERRGKRKQVQKSPREGTPSYRRRKKEGK